MEKAKLISIPSSLTTSPSKIFIFESKMFILDIGYLYIFLKNENNSSPESLTDSHCILFANIRAHKKTAELCCTQWHQDAPNTVCSVEDSEWVKELKADSPEDLKDKWVMNHYLIYLDGVGCIEAVADEVFILPEAREEFKEVNELVFSFREQAKNLLTKTGLEKNPYGC